MTSVEVDRKLDASSQGDDEILLQFVAQFIRTAAVAGVSVSILYCFAVFLLVPEQVTRYGGPGTASLILITAQALSAAGRIQAAAMLLGAGIWCVATVFGVLVAGVSTPILIIYPVLVIFCGWAISLRAAGISGLLSAMALLTIGLAQHRGMLPPPPLTPPALYAVAYTLLVFVAAVLVVYVVRAHRALLARQQRLADAIAERSAELERSRAELARAQSVGRVGSWMFDIARDEMRLSDETCRIFGVPPGMRGNTESYLGRTHEADRERLREAWARALEGGHFDQEHRLMLGKEVRWIRQIAEFERDGEGRAISAVGVTQDITERKEFERQLRDQQAHLEQMVAERTRELAAALDAAEAASSAKSAFLATISHEIRTPMNAITGLSYLLRHDGATPEQANRLRQIDLATQRLLSVINDILAVAMSESDAPAEDMQDFSLAELLGRVASQVNQAASAKGITLAIDQGGVPDALRGAPERLRRALGNYAANAVKFSEGGNVTLRVRQLGEAGDGLSLRFEVEDCGSGISREELPNLFRAFSQVDASATRRHGGAGLGLAVTRRIVESLGGEVGAESTPGRGSCFWLRLRLQRASGSVRPLPPVAGDSGFELRLTRAGARVLLVEDNEVNREVALELLRVAGIDATRADTGREALQLAGDRDFDLILMDLQMPGMDGISAARAIRALPGHAATPIVALTANAFDDDRRACFAAGMNDFLAKPVDPGQLYTALMKWLPARSPALHLSASEEEEALAAAGVEIPPLPGVDVAHGLDMLRGNAATYRRLALLFARSHRDDGARMRKAQAIGDQAELRQVAHSLKGSAGSIGALVLSELAIRLDALLRESGAVPSAELVEPLAAEADKVTAGMLAALS